MAQKASLNSYLILKKKKKAPVLHECSIAGDYAESGRESFPVALQGAAALVMGAEEQVQAGDSVDHVL